MFGISFPEFLVLGTVALLVLGPEKLPGMLRTLGQWLAKARKVTTEVRYQSGIDDVLRAEGLEGGLSELRGLVRGGLSGSVLSQAVSSHSAAHSSAQQLRSTSLDHFVPDKSREYPVEGCDAYGALPDNAIVYAEGLPKGPLARDPLYVAGDEKAILPAEAPPNAPEAPAPAAPESSPRAEKKDKPEAPAKPERLAGTNEDQAR